MVDHIKEYLKTDFENESKVRQTDSVFNTEDPKSKTDVNIKEIAIFSRMEEVDKFIEELTGERIYKDFLDDNFILRFSKDRLSRQENVKVKQADTILSDLENRQKINEGMSK